MLKAEQTEFADGSAMKKVKDDTRLHCQKMELPFICLARLRKSVKANSKCSPFGHIKFEMPVRHPSGDAE